jgi:hypothetical protein
MPKHLWLRTDESRSSLVPTYIVGAFSLILAFISIFVGIELSVTTASSDAAAAVENVNRAGKADRLPTFPAFGRNIVNPPMGILAPDQELFDGCEALASPLTRSPLAQMAGRCLS